MTIHYQNAQHEEKFINNIVHVQNLDNETFEALLENGKTLTLRAERIEGIYKE
jgi:hypothetical protein